MGSAKAQSQCCLVLEEVQKEVGNMPLLEVEGEEEGDNW